MVTTNEPMPNRRYPKRKPTIIDIVLMALAVLWCLGLAVYMVSTNG